MKAILLDGSQANHSIGVRIRTALEDIQNRKPFLSLELPEKVEPNLAPAEIRRALLLVGNPKTRKSTSFSLGGYLFEQLRTRPEWTCHDLTVQSRVLWSEIRIARLQALWSPLRSSQLNP